MKINFKITNLNSSLPKLDLSKEVAQVDEKLVKLCSLPGSYQELLQSIVASYQQVLESSTDFKPKKLVLANLFHRLSELDHANLGRFLYELKVLMRSSHMLCVISVPPGCEWKDLLQHYSDVYCSVRQIFENKKFEDFQGILKFEKLTSFGCYKQFAIETQEWGIKATQRALEIEMLYETAVD